MTFGDQLVFWGVFGAFLVYVVFDGVWRSRKTSNLDDYYAGGRTIPWWAAGLSIMATQASAITVIGTTGQGHESGMSFLQIYIGLPIAMVLLCVFIVPLLRERPILTAYEYLENRFGPVSRSIASLVFLVSRCAALGIVIYAPSVVLSATTGLPESVTVLILGAVTTGYTVFGGVTAVVWTDVKQMTVILVGLAITLVVLCTRVLDEFTFGEVLRVAGAAGKLEALQVDPPSLDFVPHRDEPSFWSDKYNLWSGLFGGTFLMLAYFGCDQSQAQRLLTSPNVNDSRKALLVSGFAKLPMQVVVLFLGVLLWMFHTIYGAPMWFDEPALARVDDETKSALEVRYDEAAASRLAALRAFAANPDDDAAMAEYRDSVVAANAVRRDVAAAVAAEGGASDRNYIFPHFVLNHLHPLLVGLIFAAIFAAAMSSCDSVLNSLSAATVVDFYRRWIAPDADDARSLAAGRTATLVWGVFATFVALFFAGGGSIIEQVNKIGSFFYGTLLGGFVLAIVCKRAGEVAASVGMVSGMAAVLVVHNTVSVEYLWYNLVGCAAVVAIGSLVAMFVGNDATLGDE